MKITLLGTGGMFSLMNFHTNYLVQDQSRPNGTPPCLLVDCGSDIRMSLAALGLTFDNVDAVYITHCHADHSGGLQYLAFSSISRPVDAPKIKLYCVRDLIEPLVDNIPLLVETATRGHQIIDALITAKGDSVSGLPSFALLVSPAIKKHRIYRCAPHDLCRKIFR